MDVISKDDVLVALRKADPLIQEAFGSNETLDTIMKLQKRYNLHADVLGAVSQELGNLLLGLIDPTSFFARIQERGVSGEAAKSIVEDINREIFLPLQKRMRDHVPPKSDAEDENDEDDFVASAPESEPPVSEPLPAITRPQVPVMNIGESASLTPNVPTQPQTPPSPPAYNLIRPEGEVMPTPTPAQAFSEPAAVTPVSVPRARTMAGDVDLLTHPVSSMESSSVIRAEQGTMPSVPHPWQTSPAQSFQTASVPYTSMPVESRAIPSLPPVQLPGEWAQAPAIPAQPVAALESPIASQPIPLTKEYGSDPYRESIT